MTDEGDRFGLLMCAEAMHGVVADVEVLVRRGCDRPGCVCGGRLAVRLVFNDLFAVAYFDRQSVDKLVNALQQATQLAWGEGHDGF